MTDELRLRAVDAEDLAVIAAMLQDARLPIAEMAFDVEARRFMAAFLRYCRERCADGGDPPECTTVLVFDHVTAAHWRGLDPDAPTATHQLLTILPDDENAGDELTVTLVFHGGEAIRLTMERIDCHLHDLGVVQPPAAADASLADSG
ncbi:MAG: DUF2948 family protein [Pseudomonadota bacterium]